VFSQCQHFDTIEVIKAEITTSEMHLKMAESLGTACARKESALRAMVASRLKESFEQMAALVLEIMASSFYISKQCIASLHLH
jgi:hypothetical protein